MNGIFGLFKWPAGCTMAKAHFASGKLAAAAAYFWCAAFTYQLAVMRAGGSCRMTIELLLNDGCCYCNDIRCVVTKYDILLSFSGSNKRQIL
jgi:hypothetical protein